MGTVPFPWEPCGIVYLRDFPRHSPFTVGAPMGLSVYWDFSSSAVLARGRRAGHPMVTFRGGTSHEMSRGKSPGRVPPQSSPPIELPRRKEKNIVPVPCSGELN